MKEVILLRPVKTASTTVGRGILEPLALTKFRNGHRTPKKIIAEQIKKERFEEAFKVITVRNPYDRMVSAYEFYKIIRAREGKPFYDSFHDFVMGTTIRPMIRYAFLGERNILDFIIHFERLRIDVYKLFSLLKIKQVPRIPHLQKTNNHPPYQTYYQGNSLDKIVYDKYRQDFEFFGYSRYL